MRLFISFILLPGFLLAQNPNKSFELIHPRLSGQLGFCIPEFYNLGFDVNMNYYAFKNKWLRLGPGAQINNFYVVNNNWFNSNNTEKTTSSELRFNALCNIDFIPFKNSSFYIGFAPYFGYQWLNNNGNLRNDLSGINIDWNYNIHSIDVGTRYKLGGYFGKNQRYGLEVALQISNRGVLDDNPLTSFFNFGMPTYKSYISFAFLYRIF